MRFVDNHNVTDPRINLAIEEHLLRNIRSESELLLFYINEPSVIIGRNQNTIEEIDPDYVKASNIHVVRRLSGGGAVFHDLGNLNFSFITTGREDVHNFHKFLKPVVAALNKLGVPAEIHGKSDIVTAGKKISGNAQFSTGNRMFSHGTILFNTNLYHMLQAINPRQIEVESKAVQSVRKFVANIADWTDESITVNDVKNAILREIFGDGERDEYKLSEADWDKINELSESRYRSWEWNIGRSPKYNFKKSHNQAGSKVDVHLDVSGGIIKDINIFGNFTGVRPLSELRDVLVGQMHDPSEIGIAFASSNINIKDYINNISDQEFLNLLY